MSGKEQVQVIRFTQKRLYGTSMLPEMEPGALLTIDQEHPFERLRVGDIVEFVDPRIGEWVVHRLVQKRELKRRKYGLIGPVVSTETAWKTKGDNRRFRDRGHLTWANYLGRVVYVNGRRIAP